MEDIHVALGIIVGWKTFNDSCSFGDNSRMEDIHVALGIIVGRKTFM